MINGMLWFDNSPDTTLKEKIEKAISYYVEKYKKQPNLCLIHPNIFRDDIKISGIEIKPYRPVLPGHIWIGIE